MKQTTIIGTLLTFLMLLLILLAAVSFLWQGRQQLQIKNEMLQGEVQTLQGTVETLHFNTTNLNLTLTESANNLVTSVAEQETLDQQIFDLRATINAMPPLTNTAIVTPLVPPLAITATPNSGMNNSQPSGTNGTPTP